MEKQKVLITGGSGLMGRLLSKKLHNFGYEIRILSRKKTSGSEYSSFHWDIDDQEMDIEAIKDVNYLIHLAGENISEKAWTKKQKIVIENSRVKSLQLIYQTCLKNNIWPKALISSSAIGYYGTFNSEQILTEKSPAGSDFLGMIGKKWEAAADLFEKHKVRTVKIRTGVVLSKNGAAYPKMAKPAKYGLAAAFGTGNQYVPWIHIDDIVDIFIKAMEDEKLEGVYNGVAPSYLTNKELTKAIAKGLNKPYFLPNIPLFALKILPGVKACIDIGPNFKALIGSISPIKSSTVKSGLP